MNKNAALIIIFLLIVIGVSYFVWKIYPSLQWSVPGAGSQGTGQGVQFQQQSILDRIEAAILAKLKNK